MIIEMIDEHTQLLIIKETYYNRQKDRYRKDRSLKVFIMMTLPVRSDSSSLYYLTGKI